MLFRSVDESVLQRESSVNIQNDPSVAEMRVRLAHAIQGIARAWSSDIEVAQVR